MTKRDGAAEVKSAACDLDDLARVVGMHVRLEPFAQILDDLLGEGSPEHVMAWTTLCERFDDMPITFDAPTLRWVVARAIRDAHDETGGFLASFERHLDVAFMPACA
jgi:hypothetical protein